MIDFTSIDYLKNGNLKQQRVYDVLNAHSVFSKLAKFNPILVGTIPINIDTEKSDLDIICCWTNKAEFISTLKTSFCNEIDFSVSEKIKNNNEVVVAKFMLEEFPVEVYGQNLPTMEQNGYRHMVIEHKLLLKKGEEFRQQVVNLKKQGYKTEPAFAKLLGLENDPFQGILNFQFD